MFRLLRRAALLAFVAVSAYGQPHVPHAPAPPAAKRILFIGNSLTYCNDLPALMRALFAAAHENVEMGQHTPGGTSLAQHAADPEVAKLIADGHWTHVVLQDQSALPAAQPETTREAGRKLCDLARAAGATPVYYLTWGYPDAKPPGMNVAMQRALNRAYAAAAMDSKALLAPVGPAWQAALEQNPKLRLYLPNDYHPSPEGSFLAACVLYAAIAQRSPEGLAGPTTPALPPAQVRWYQHLAWTTVQRLPAASLAEQGARPGP